MLRDLTAHPLFKPTTREPARRRWYEPETIPKVLFYSGSGLLLLLILLVPAYILVRLLGAGPSMWVELWQPHAFSILANTLGLALAVTVASVLLGVPIAWLTTCSDLPYRRLWFVLTTLPLVIPSYIAAFLYISLLGGGGPIRQFLAANFSLTSLPSIYGFGGAFLVLTFVSFPYVTLTTRASLKRMDPALVEAARSLGLSPRQAFARITLPYLRPAIVAGALLTTLYVIRDFGAVTMLQYSTFTRVIYNRYLAYRLDSAAGFALMLIALAMALLYLEQRSRGNAVYSRLSTGAARRARVSRLGSWKAPALAFVSTVVLVTLLLPAYGLGFWLVRGLRNEWMVQLPGAEQSTMQVVASLVQPAVSTISASSMGAIAAAMLALPVAFLIVRRPGRLTRLLERTTYAAFAIPGIVVALAYVFFGARYGGSLYQTLPMMLAAYVVLFIPQAVGAQRASFLQLSPSLEEAGRGLGHGAAVIFRRITIPLVRPGILSGVALVFLTCMKELPATLILSPLGFETLAAQIWSSIGEAFFARAALPAMLLLLLSSLPLAIITLKDTEST